MTPERIEAAIQYLLGSAPDLKAYAALSSAPTNAITFALIQKLCRVCLALGLYVLRERDDFD